MARWNLPNFMPGYSAIISTHGYFEIVGGEKSPGYAESVWNSGPVEDGHGNRLPKPSFIYHGHVEELGITYLPEWDDIDIDNDLALREMLRVFWIRKIDLSRI